MNIVTRNEVNEEGRNATLGSKGNDWERLG
jgi:hypothetical protein